MHFSDQLKNKSQLQLQVLDQNTKKGCHKIFHKKGYMNLKGDAPYDFNCDENHRCRYCQQKQEQIHHQINQRKYQKIKQQNAIKMENQLKQAHNYFKGQPGCECKQNNICKKCLQKLQLTINGYQNGCGKTWTQQFGGLAAGPGEVTCSKAYLCDGCQKSIALIKKANKSYPHVVLKSYEKDESYH